MANTLVKVRAAEVDPDLVEMGGRIRTRRESLGLSLRDLSERSGLSVGHLSQVERGLSAIALLSLRSVAIALGFTLNELMSGSGPIDEGSPADGYCHVHRADAGVDTSYVSGARTYVMLSNRAPELVLEPLVVHIAPGDLVEDAYAHDGEEFAYVLSGELLMTVDDIEHRLGPGDSIHIRSTVPHSIRNEGEEVCTVVSVVTPRLF